MNFEKFVNLNESSLAGQGLLNTLEKAGFAYIEINKGSTALLHKDGTEFLLFVMTNSGKYVILDSKTYKIIGSGEVKTPNELYTILVDKYKIGNPLARLVNDNTLKGL